MICVYLDDSFCKDTSFQKEMQRRLFIQCSFYEVDFICISKSDPNVTMEHPFILELKKRGYEVILSPSSFDIQGVCGLLQVHALTLQPFDQMQTFSGSFLIYDTEAGSCERIYLDIFPNYPLIVEEVDLKEQLVELLMEYMGKENKHMKQN